MPHGAIASSLRKGSGLSSLTKMLAIMGLLDTAAPVLQAEEIAARLGYSRPQSYRYIRELCDAGFLIRFRSGYALGPRCIQLDYIIRQSDPLLRASEPIMRELRDQNGCDVLLANMFGDRIVAVHHERGFDPTTISYSRGRLMPLFRGAGSKVILAGLPVARQRRIVHAHAGELAESAIGQSWDEIRTALRTIKRDDFALSRGELDAVNVGIAVPLVVESSMPPASLVLVLNAARFRTTDLNAVILIARNARDHIIRTLTAGDGLRLRPMTPESSGSTLG